jgi:hypothetical protein
MVLCCGSVSLLSGLCLGLSVNYHVREAMQSDVANPEFACMSGALLVLFYAKLYYHFSSVFFFKDIELRSSAYIIYYINKGVLEKIKRSYHVR